jgi:hypothetical protein
MMVEVVRRPTSWAVPDHVQPFGGVDLVGQMMARTSSSRISAAVPGSEPSPRPSAAQEVASGTPSVARPAHLERREGVDVHAGRAAFTARRSSR